MTRKALMLLATIALMVVAAGAVATAATLMGETSTHVSLKSFGIASPGLRFFT